MSEEKDISLDFIRYVIGTLVEHPEDLVIEKTIDDIGVLINLQCHRDDMGRIIGKNGQTIKSIRILLRIIGKRENQKINLKIVEPVE